MRRLSWAPPGPLVIVWLDNYLPSARGCGGSAAPDKLLTAGRHASWGLFCIDKVLGHALAGDVRKGLFWRACGGENPCSIPTSGRTIPRGSWPPFLWTGLRASSEPVRCSGRRTTHRPVSCGPPRGWVEVTRRPCLLPDYGPCTFRTARARTKRGSRSFARKRFVPARFKVFTHSARLDLDILESVLVDSHFHFHFHYGTQIRARRPSVHRHV